MTGVLLAAHGSADGEVQLAVEEIARGLADRLALPVTTGFHLGTPGFAEAASAAAGDPLVVLPLMLARGYFSGSVLPEAVGESESPARQVVFAPPLGAHPRLPAHLAARAHRAATQAGFSRPFVALIGHGTARDPASRRTALEAAEEIEVALGAPCRAFFLDDSPSVDLIAPQVGDGDLVVLPFLLGGGRHATADLERATEREAGRRSILEPLLEDPGLADFLVDLVEGELADRG